MSELKPCPFCGGAIILRDSRGGMWDISTGEVTYGCSFICERCGCEVRHRGKTKFVKEHYDAIIYDAADIQWNTRPVEDALRKELEDAKNSIRNIDSAYKWYNEDTYENCISVVSDAIYFAMEKIERIESK